MDSNKLESLGLSYTNLDTYLMSQFFIGLTNLIEFSLELYA